MTTSGPDRPLDLGPVLRAADQRLVRTVDELPDADWSGPSLLPGWTRAHVVAHLALNAEALAGCLAGLVAGQPTPMYPSEQARDDGIAILGQARPAELREQLMGATTVMSTALAEVAQLVLEADAGTSGGAPLLTTQLERSPGGRRFTVGSVAATRVREVEIHHVDLDTGYRSADWHPWLSGHIIDVMASRAGVPRLTLAPDDDPRRWTPPGETGTDDAEPVEVGGPLDAIAWWITGRADAGALRASGGALPLLPAW